MILIVEDHAGTADSLVKLLGRRGMCAVAYQTGAEALDVAATLRPTCVVLDYELPDMSGLDVLRAMREQVDLADVPAVIYSAIDDSDRRLQEEAARLGASGWVPKQRGPLHLMSTVDRICHACDESDNDDNDNQATADRRAVQ